MKLQPEVAAAELVLLQRRIVEIGECPGLSDPESLHQRSIPMIVGKQKCYLVEECSPISYAAEMDEGSDSMPEYILPAIF